MVLPDLSSLLDLSKLAYVGATITGVVLLIQQYQTIRKLRLENDKLRREQKLSESRIIRPTEADVEKYGSVYARKQLYLIAIISGTATLGIAQILQPSTVSMSSPPPQDRLKEIELEIENLIKNIEKRCVNPAQVDIEILQNLAPSEYFSKQRILGIMLRYCDDDKRIVERYRTLKKQLPSDH